MVALNPNKSCLNARPYYYDFLYDKNREGIPESVSEHIIQCQRCREEIKRLNKLLLPDNTVADAAQNRQNMAVTALLRLHFAYLDELVACKSVRPFLPALVVSGLELRIPTPITAHLDKCDTCSEDLKTLRSLNLTDKQLYRLGQFFADEASESTVSCSQARSAATKAALIDFQETDAEVLKHLCVCSDCRKAMYQHREALRSDLPNEGASQTEFPCEGVSTTDIFDYCIPYGIDPANDEYARFRESLASHLRACPKCLAKMQQLHETVYGIAERADSGIITRYELASAPEKAEFDDFDSLYADWPIRVGVFGSPKSAKAYSAEAVSDVLPNASEKRTRILRLRRIIKPAIAAAAVLAVALFLFSGPTAKAVDFSQVYQAIQNAKNVCIATFAFGRDEPAQKIWVSRTSDIRLQTTKKQAVLFDIRNVSRMQKDLATGTVETTTMAGDFLAKIKSHVTSTLGLAPFSPEELKGISGNAQWARVENEDVEAILPGCEVYDLIWIQKPGRHHRWRYFIDSITKQPRRLETYAKIAVKSDYELETVQQVTYPTDSEFNAAVLSAFGQP